jgi:MFS family permease
VSAFAASFTGRLAQRYEPKWLILSGQTLMLIASILLAFASSADRYWPYMFPAFFIGSGGTEMAFIHTKYVTITPQSYHQSVLTMSCASSSIAIFRTTPPAMAGTVGAVFIGMLQLGSAVGVAAMTTIETSVEARHSNGFMGYAGRSAAMWFLVALVAAGMVITMVFYRPRKSAAPAREDIAAGTVSPELMELEEKSRAPSLA